MGGVAIYISKRCSYKIIPKYSLGLPEVEDLWIELKLTKRNVLLALYIYRHSKYANVEGFLLTLNKTLKNISSDNKLCYILGDLNINTYDTSNNVGKTFLN